MSLQTQRINYKPKLPVGLLRLKHLSSIAEKQAPFKPSNNENLAALFPGTYHLPVVGFSVESDRIHKPLKVGVVLSGGPAAGGHSVISGLFDALKILHPESSLFGFLDGPKGIIENKSIQITHGMLSNFRNTGGFDLIGSGRTKIETEEQFNASEQTVRSLDLEGLVVIGGDDSNTNAALLAEYFLQKHNKTRVVGVPKTIDGDLKNEYVEISFGFDSACKTYSELIGNINRDALSQKKYYFFIKLMGRSASHVTLECALQTQPNMALIGEEIEQKKLSLSDVANLIADMICLRSEQGKNFGVILIPEGIIEFIPECRKLIQELNLSSKLSEASQDCFDKMPSEIQKQLLLDRDSHANVQVSKIESERMLIEMVKKELSERQNKGLYRGQFNPQPLFYGYEGRCCFPTNFDTQYCYALGYAAALLVDNGLTGYMTTISHLAGPIEKWKVRGIPFARMIHLENRKGKLKPVIKKTLVDLDSPIFQLFASKRAGWALEDRYLFPGPIQFFGPESLTSAVTFTIAE